MRDDIRHATSIDRLESRVDYGTMSQTRARAGLCRAGRRSQGPETVARMATRHERTELEDYATAAPGRYATTSSCSTASP